MPRGGNRQGQQGKAYSNRSDLNPALKPQAIQGGQYGSVKAQIDSQKAVPMASAPLPVQGQPTSPVGQPFPAPQAPLTPLDAPTQRPDEHLMTGVGDSTLMPPTPADPAFTMLSLLNNLGDSVSPQVQYIRTYLQLQAQNQMPH